MAEEIEEYSEGNSDPIETKSAVTLSALFVLRKLLFNSLRYRFEDLIDHDNNLRDFLGDLKQAYRLFSWAHSGETANTTQLEQYIFQVQIHELLYKIHHTLLSIMPHNLDKHIRELDELIEAFNPENETDFKLYRLEAERLILWLDELTT